ncbi:TsoY family (seleno)protein [Granulicoccus sp. GXG6511]|uniref:TsoY family (seleno)protein n=1 Tax=Granulicoccus sp. GXG6511 TaxID=3381351 RepID=UPI003D7CB28B
MPRFAREYRPLYFLAALGAGGLSVSFFMYLMFLIPHPTSPMPTFSDVVNVYRVEGIGLQVMTTLALIGIVFFAIKHVLVLLANLRAFNRLRREPAYRALRSSNGEVTLMAVPLTLAMTVNVLFILGALGIPGLWSKVEWLFPFSLLAFSAIGALAFFFFGRYLARLISQQGFDNDDTNHFSQILPAFAFTMIAVGFAAPAAMSKITAVSVLGMVGAFIFLAAAAAWILVKLPVSFAAILRNGLAIEGGPTLWMGIPIFTLVGITFVRLASGVSHNLLDTELNPVITFVVLGLLVAAQLVMGLIGWAVMRRQGYFARFVRGTDSSIPSYGLICPGVALSVLSMFFIHWGLVKTDIVTLFSPVHLALHALVLLLQVRTIQTLFQLDRRLMGDPKVSHNEPVAKEEELAAV